MRLPGRLLHPCTAKRLYVALVAFVGGGLG